MSRTTNPDKQKRITFIKKIQSEPSTQQNKNLEGQNNYGINIGVRYPKKSLTSTDPTLLTLSHLRAANELRSASS